MRVVSSYPICVLYISKTSPNSSCDIPDMALVHLLAAKRKDFTFILYTYVYKSIYIYMHTDAYTINMTYYT